MISHSVPDKYYQNLELKKAHLENLIKYFSFIAPLVTWTGPGLVTEEAPSPKINRKKRKIFNGGPPTQEVERASSPNEIKQLNEIQKKLFLDREKVLSILNIGRPLFISFCYDIYRTQLMGLQGGTLSDPIALKNLIHPLVRVYITNKKKRNFPDWFSRGKKDDRLFIEKTITAWICWELLHPTHSIIQVDPPLAHQLLGLTEEKFNVLCKGLVIHKKISFTGLNEEEILHKLINMLRTKVVNEMSRKYQKKNYSPYERSWHRDILYKTFSSKVINVLLENGTITNDISSSLIRMLLQKNPITEKKWAIQNKLRPIAKPKVPPVSKYCQNIHSKEPKKTKASPLERQIFKPKSSPNTSTSVAQGMGFFKPFPPIIQGEEDSLNLIALPFFEPSAKEKTNEFEEHSMLPESPLGPMPLSPTLASPLLFFPSLEEEIIPENLEETCKKNYPDYR